MGVILTREEWKFVSMRYGVYFVTTSVHMSGLVLKQMLFVNSWDSPELVSKHSLIPRPHPLFNVTRRKWVWPGDEAK